MSTKSSGKRKRLEVGADDANTGSNNRKLLRQYGRQQSDDGSGGSGSKSKKAGSSGGSTAAPGGRDGSPGRSTKVRDQVSAYKEVVLAAARNARATVQADAQLLEQSLAALQAEQDTRNEQQQQQREHEQQMQSLPPESDTMQDVEFQEMTSPRQEVSKGEESLPPEPVQDVPPVLIPKQAPAGLMDMIHGGGNRTPSTPSSVPPVPVPIVQDSSPDAIEHVQPSAQLPSPRPLEPPPATSPLQQDAHTVQEQQLESGTNHVEVDTIAHVPSTHAAALDNGHQSNHQHDNHIHQNVDVMNVPVHIDGLPPATLTQQVPSPMKVDQVDGIVKPHKEIGGEVVPGETVAAQYKQPEAWNASGISEGIPPIVQQPYPPLLTGVSNGDSSSTSVQQIQQHPPLSGAAYVHVPQGYMGIAAPVVTEHSNAVLPAPSPFYQNHGVGAPVPPVGMMDPTASMAWQYPSTMYGGVPGMAIDPAAQALSAVPPSAIPTYAPLATPAIQEVSSVPGAVPMQIDVQSAYVPPSAMLPVGPSHIAAYSNEGVQPSVGVYEHSQVHGGQIPIHSTAALVNHTVDTTGGAAPAINSADGSSVHPPLVAVDQSMEVEMKAPQPEPMNSDAAPSVQPSTQAEMEVSESPKLPAEQLASSPLELSSQEKENKIDLRHKHAHPHHRDAMGAIAAARHQELMRAQEERNAADMPFALTEFQKFQQLEEYLEKYRAKQAELRAALEGQQRINAPDKRLYDTVDRSHWDHLLNEMKLMATDFHEEGKWKRSVAARLALEVAVEVRSSEPRDAEVRTIEHAVASHIAHFNMSGASADNNVSAQGQLPQGDVTSAVMETQAYPVSLSDAPNQQREIKHFNWLLNLTASGMLTPQGVQMVPDLSGTFVIANGGGSAHEQIPLPYDEDAGEFVSHRPNAITLMEHQVMTLRWISALSRKGAGPVLADPPGTGKTTTVAVRIAHVVKERDAAVAAHAVLIEKLRLEAEAKEVTDLAEKAAIATAKAQDMAHSSLLGAAINPDIRNSGMTMVVDAHLSSSSTTGALANVGVGTGELPAFAHQNQGLNHTNGRQFGAASIHSASNMPMQIDPPLQHSTSHESHSVSGPHNNQHATVGVIDLSGSDVTSSSVAPGPPPVPLPVCPYPQLLIAPTRSLVHWCAEIGSAMPSIRIAFWDKWRRLSNDSASVDLVICSLARAATDAKEELQQIPWFQVVVDFPAERADPSAACEVPKPAPVHMSVGGSNGEQIQQPVVNAADEWDDEVQYVSAAVAAVASHSIKRIAVVRSQRKAFHENSSSPGVATSSADQMLALFKLVLPRFYPAGGMVWDQAAAVTLSAVALRRDPLPAQLYQLQHGVDSNGSGAAPALTLECHMPPAQAQAYQRYASQSGNGASTAKLKRACLCAGIERSRINGAVDVSLLDGKYIESRSGKLAALGKALNKLYAAGKRSLIVAYNPEALPLVSAYLKSIGVKHECCSEALDHMLRNNRANSDGAQWWLRSQCAVWRHTKGVCPVPLLASPSTLTLLSRRGGLKLGCIDAVFILDSNLDSNTHNNCTVSDNMSISNGNGSSIQRSIDNRYLGWLWEAQGLRQGGKKATFIKLVLLGTIEDPHPDQGQRLAQAAALPNEPAPMDVEPAPNDVVPVAAINPTEDTQQQSILHVATANSDTQANAQVAQATASTKVEPQGASSADVDDCEWWDLQSNVLIQLLKTIAPSPLEAVAASLHHSATYETGDLTPFALSAQTNSRRVLEESSTTPNLPASINLLVYTVPSTGNSTNTQHSSIEHSIVTAFNSRSRALRLLGVQTEPLLHTMPILPPDAKPEDIHDALRKPLLRGSTAAVGGDQLGFSLSYVEPTAPVVQGSDASRDKPLRRRLSQKANLPPGTPYGIGLRSPSSMSRGPIPPSRRMDFDMAEEWTAAEDSYVLQAVEYFGQSWALVAFILNRDPAVSSRLRSSSQCADRYAKLAAGLPAMAAAAAATAAALLPSHKFVAKQPALLPRPPRGSLLHGGFARFMGAVITASRMKVSTDGENVVMQERAIGDDAGGGSAVVTAEVVPSAEGGSSSSASAVDNAWKIVPNAPEAKEDSRAALRCRFAVLSEKAREHKIIKPPSVPDQDPIQLSHASHVAAMFEANSTGGCLAPSQVAQTLKERREGIAPQGNAHT